MIGAARRLPPSSTTTTATAIIAPAVLLVPTAAAAAAATAEEDEEAKARNRKRRLRRRRRRTPAAVLALVIVLRISAAASTFPQLSSKTRTTTPPLVPGSSSSLFRPLGGGCAASSSSSSSTRSTVITGVSVRGGRGGGGRLQELAGWLRRALAPGRGRNRRRGYAERHLEEAEEAAAAPRGEQRRRRQNRRREAQPEGSSVGLESADGTEEKSSSIARWRRRRRSRNGGIRETENEEEDEEDENASSTEVRELLPWSSGIPQLASAALQSLLSDKRRLARWTASGVQLGLMAYLLRAVWKAVEEIVEEYNNNAYDFGGENGGGSGGFIKSDDVAKVLRFLERRTSPDEDSFSQQQPPQLPPLAVLQLARNLAASGLPLRSPDRDPASSSSVSDGGAVASVESVLLQLTKGEASILQQCLWVPPVPPTVSPSSVQVAVESDGEEKEKTSASSSSPLHDMWMQVVGLYPVKERLLGALTTLYRQHHRRHDSHRPRPDHDGDGFASLFDSAGGGASSAGPVSQGILLYGPPGTYFSSARR